MYKNEIIFGICSVLSGISMGIFFSILKYVNIQNKSLGTILGTSIIIVESIVIFCLYKLNLYWTVGYSYTITIIIISIIAGATSEEIFKYFLRDLITRNKIERVDSESWTGK